MPFDGDDALADTFDRAMAEYECFRQEESSRVFAAGDYRIQWYIGEPKSAMWEGLDYAGHVGVSLTPELIDHFSRPGGSHIIVLR